MSRIAATALVAVFAMTGAFTLWSMRTADKHTEEVLAARAMSELYTRESDLVSQTELFVTLWLSTGDPQYLDRKTQTDALAAAVMAKIALSSRAEDRQFAAWATRYFDPMGAIFLRLQETPPPPIEELLAQYVVAYRRLYDSIKRGDLGDPALADQLADPYVVLNAAELGNPVTVIAGAKAAERQASAAAAVAATDGAERTFKTFAPLLYGAGTLLFVILLIVRLQFVKAVARTNAENEQLRRLSTTDALTHLGNRRGFEEATKRLAASGSPGLAALIMMDLDEFKVVNDTFGHARGDLLLANFARLLSSLAPPGASRFRIGGDEFALILHGVDGAGSLALAERIRLAASDALGNGVTVSAGVAVLDPEHGDESLLVQQADAALYEGKMRGRNLAVLFSGKGNAAPLFPAAKLQAVRRLLEEGRIHAVFQPIWDIQSHSLVGYEGLSRPDEDYGLDGPQQAFDIAEQFGHVADLDTLCRKHLLSAAGELPSDSRLFINLSPYSLTHQSFSPATLLGELAAAGIATARVVFEVTERSTVPVEAIAEAVVALRTHGFAVALDDVGAGNNGLEMLQKVSFDYVKVDRGVILAAGQAGKGRAGLMAILAFASESGAVVVAEGIENVETFALVCDIAARASLRGSPRLIHAVQGYLFGRPLPAELTAKEGPPELAA